MKQILINIIRTKGIEYGNFTLKSGLRSTYYLDLRKLTLSGMLPYIIEELSIALRDIKFEAIGGPCIGADPIVGGYLALKAKEHTRGFLIRTTEKNHGKSGRIIGSICSGDRCVVVDDVTTTGDSLLDSCREVQKFGARVVQAITIVDRQQGANELFQKEGIPFRSLILLEELDIT